MKKCIDYTVNTQCSIFIYCAYCKQLYLYNHTHAYFRCPSVPARMKPKMVDEYNKYMLGVDRLDQRMSYHQFARKSVRWWRKVFFWMMEVAVVNAYILYTQHTNDRRKMAHKQFRRELVLALCQPQRDNTTQRHLSIRDHTLERLRGQHFPETGSARRGCRVCSSRKPGGVRHLTTAFCSTCSDNPHLCIGDCFRKYHTRATFREE